MNDNVVDFNFYKRIADSLKAQGRTVKEDNLAYRIERIRVSIERINNLMEDLKKGPPSKIKE